MTTKKLTLSANLIALSAILSYIKLYQFPQGGSITLCAMLPILIISWKFGAKIAMLSGAVFGFIMLLIDPYILHPAQVLLDYPLPFMTFGAIAAIIKNRYLSIVAAFLGRFICHFASGVFFFSSFAPEGMSPVIYSIIANATYLLPEMLLTIIVVKIIAYKLN